VPSADSTALRDFLSRSRAQGSSVYRVRPGDQLTTRFYYNPQLDQDFQVRPDGTISMSLIGELKAAGKTASELSELISQAYAQYFTKSKAVVIVRALTGYRAFTAGQLNKPGQIDIVGGAKTVLESLAVSGGVTEEGTLSNVYLIRKLPGEKAPLVAVLNLKEALSGEDPTQDVALMPDDFVFVPRSGAATLNVAMQQYVFRNLNLSTGVGADVGFKPNSTPANSSTIGGKPVTTPGKGATGSTPSAPMMTAPTPAQTTPSTSFTPARP
jgi:polysaccharide export outer membrane protein